MGACGGEEIVFTRGAGLGDGREDASARCGDLLISGAGDTLLDPSSAESEITALLCACDAPNPDGASAPLPTAIRATHPDELLARAMESVAMTGRGGRGWQPPRGVGGILVCPWIWGRIMATSSA